MSRRQLSAAQSDRRRGRAAAAPRTARRVGRLRDHIPAISSPCATTTPPASLAFERHVDQWVEQLVAVSAEVRRVLVPTGTFWLNLGDTYSSRPSQGAQRKSLLMAPERVAMRLQDSGWIIRNKIVWANPTPFLAASPTGLTAPTK